MSRRFRLNREIKTIFVINVFYQLCKLKKDRSKQNKMIDKY